MARREGVEDRGYRRAEACSSSRSPFSTPIRSLPGISSSERVQARSSRVGLSGAFIAPEPPPAGVFAGLRDLRNNLRVMRKARTLATLFPTLRGELLAATLIRPDKWWYLSELAGYLQTTPSSLQRELKALVAGGILQQRREGTRTYFKAETRSPLFPELRGLLEKTAGLLPTLQQSLEPFRSRIDCAFVYGSVARGEEHALSDVDLMVIGDVGVADLAPALRKAEGQLGREINVTSYSAREFRTKSAAKDHFPTEVLHGSKEFVQGNQRDLDEIVGRQGRSASSNVKKRAR